MVVSLFLQKIMSGCWEFIYEIWRMIIKALSSPNTVATPAEIMSAFIWDFLRLFSIIPLIN